MKPILLALAAVSLVACGPHNIGGPGGGNTGTDAGTKNYPAGPYGTTVGAVFPDMRLTGVQFPGTGGYIDPAMNPLRNAVTDIPAANSSNPSASPYFNTDMAFHQLYALKQAGFRYALIDVSSIWCPHCLDEAKQLPNMYVPVWLPKGGVVFSVIEDGPNPGTPATMDEFNNTWVNAFHLNYPITVDPQEQLVTALNLRAWPANFIIKLDDMTVVKATFGADFTFFDAFTNLLNQP